MKTENHFIAFSYGAIGEFLMTAILIKNLKESGQFFRFSVITTRNVDTIRVISRKYPFISVYSIYSFEGFISVLRSLFNRTTVFIPFTFGDVPSKIKIFSHLLTLHPKGERVGLFLPSNNWTGYTKAIPFDPEKLFVENLFSLGKKIVENLGEDKTLSLPSENFFLKEQKIDEFSYIAIGPTAASPKRSFPIDRWRDLVKLVSKEFPSTPILFLGSKKDTPFIQKIIKDIPSTFLFDCSGISFEETIGIIKSAQVFLGVDSGLSHIAGVLSAPSVVLGNRTNPSWLPYYNKNATILFETKNCVCIGIKKEDCTYTILGNSYYRCLVDIKNETIIFSMKEKIVSRSQMRGKEE